MFCARIDPAVDDEEVGVGVYVCSTIRINQQSCLTLTHPTNTYPTKGGACLEVVEQEEVNLVLDLEHQEVLEADHLEMLHHKEEQEHQDKEITVAHRQIQVTQMVVEEVEPEVLEHQDNLL